jgi:hypothetical protein
VTVKIVVTTTLDYLSVARGFLESVRQVRSAEVYCVCYKFGPNPNLERLYPHIRFVSLPAVWSESHGMLQWGPFLDTVPHSPGDVVVLSDTDVIVQRDFTAEEWEYLEGLGEGEVGAWYNDGPQDTLKAEGERIGFPTDSPLPLYNGGLLAAKVSTFRRVQDDYESDCLAFYAQCQHRSRCQMHLWRAFHRMPGPKAVKVLPPLMHRHNHFSPFSVMSPDDLSRVMFLHTRRDHV